MRYSLFIATNVNWPSTKDEPVSKLETPMTRWYWCQVGGTLVEEFCAVRGSVTHGTRWIDGIIVKGSSNRIVIQNDVVIAGKDIVVVQTKAERLGMSLMGQAFFSAKLMRVFKPRSIQSVALVSETDDVLGPMLESYPRMRVVVCPQRIHASLSPK